MKNKSIKALDATPQVKNSMSNSKVRNSGVGAVHYMQIKDTATLWVRCRQVEMAERLGQKLQEKNGTATSGEQLQ